MTLTQRSICSVMSEFICVAEWLILNYKCTKQCHVKATIVCHSANYQDCAVSLLGIPVCGSADGVVILSLTGLAASVVGEGCVVCVALALREVACIVKRIGAQ